MWTVSEGINVLRGRGAKITAQRIAILKQLEGRTDHPSADILYKELSVDYPTMSVATVYSTAQLLADAGLIVGVGHRHRVAQRRERSPDRYRLTGGSERLDTRQTTNRGGQGTVAQQGQGRRAHTFVQALQGLGQGVQEAGRLVFVAG